MKFEFTETWGFAHAIRGMRNPHESWHLSDSWPNSIENPAELQEIAHGILHHIGFNDLILMKTLIKSGPDHRKFLRQIMVSVDITAPLYWFKEFDTYKVGTTSNSTSTMHKLANTPIHQDCFEHTGYNSDDSLKFCWTNIINTLESLRLKYKQTKDPTYWKQLIQLLPESWLQTRTITMNYENLYNMVHARQNHKLTEWSTDFITWAKTLPYAQDLLFIKK